MNLSPEDKIPRSRLLRFYFARWIPWEVNFGNFAELWECFSEGFFELLKWFGGFCIPKFPDFSEIFASRNFENLFLRHIPKFYLFTDGIQKRLGCRENGLNICMKLKSIDQKFSEELKIFTLPMEFMSAVTEIGSHKGWSSNKMILTFDHVSSAAPKSRISHG